MEGWMQLGIVVAPAAPPHPNPHDVPVFFGYMLMNDLPPGFTKQSQEKVMKKDKEDENERAIEEACTTQWNSVYGVLANSGFVR